ncbi:Asp/Glu racemase [Xylariales sp. AK1849]|nr:Asp/Glu racemase [Xylariales sp. AK1849]
MRTLGLIGGMTYHATTIYYDQINEYVQKHLGGDHSAKIVLHSVDYAEIMTHFHGRDFEECSRQLCTIGKNLKSIGADALVLCVNTSHMWAGDIEKAAGVPLLHIIDFTAEAILEAGLKKVALLGTKPTMEGDFIKGRLQEKHGLEVLVPAEDVRNQMNDAIFQELPQKIVTPLTKRLFIDSVEDLVRRGAQGIILGCTELQFVLKPGDVESPLFDTVALHAQGAAKWALEH